MRFHQKVARTPEGSKNEPPPPGVYKIPCPSLFGGASPQQVYEYGGKAFYRSCNPQISPDPPSDLTHPNLARKISTSPTPSKPKIYLTQRPGQKWSTMAQPPPPSVYKMPCPSLFAAACPQNIL